MNKSVYGVSVIICAYTEKRWYDLVAAVKSVKQQISPPREIIVVIDHNPSLFKLAQTQFTNVVVIENKEPRGLSGARNSGIAVAQGEFIAFLDDDAVADADWLELLNQSCQNPQVLGVGGVVVPMWMDKCPKWFPEEFYWVLGCTYKKPPAKPIVVRNPYGGCTCIRREVFEAVGGFRSDIGRIGSNPMGGEETELSIRASQHWPHKVFLLEPNARIHHRIPSQRATWHYFCSRCYAEGLSKATITKYVGAQDSLSEEREYTFRTLPKGVAHGIADSLFRFDPTGCLRAVAIITGLLMTALGYLVGTFSSRSNILKENRKNITPSLQIMSNEEIGRV